MELGRKFVKLLIHVSGTLLETFTYKVTVEICCINKTLIFGEDAALPREARG